MAFGLANALEGAITLGGFRVEEEGLWRLYGDYAGYRLEAEGLEFKA